MLSRLHRCFASVVYVAAAFDGPLRAASDPQAVELAHSVMEHMGGQEAWNATRFVQWKFFGRRQHHWDRHTGDVRIHQPAGQRPDGTPVEDVLVLMNVHSKKGRVWKSGSEVLDTAEREAGLERGHEWWVNDSYWMFMPFKLVDPGVKLRYVGSRSLPDGRSGEVLELTFEPGIGYTPENRYEVWVSGDTGLIEQWSFYAEAGDAEPQFTLPWAEWKEFGAIRLATRHLEQGADEADWEIAVPSDVPRSLFERP